MELMLPFSLTHMLSSLCFLGPMQATTFSSLGVLLQCSWAELEVATRNEPRPSFFRLAVCCWMFDQVRAHLITI